MRRKRAITLKFEPPALDAAVEQPLDDRPIEEKVAAVLTVFENVGKKVLIGICTYVLVDTVRQVAVAKAQQPTR